MRRIQELDLGLEGVVFRLLSVDRITFPCASFGLFPTCRQLTRNTSIVQWACFARAGMKVTCWWEYPSYAADVSTQSHRKK
jgi:hypothetical protein